MVLCYYQLHYLHYYNSYYHYVITKNKIIIYIIIKKIYIILITDYILSNIYPIIVITISLSNC